MIGHDAALARISTALRRDRFTGSFLLVGPPGIGKSAVALRIAAAIFCERREAAELSPCGECPPCRQVAAGTHPDLVQVAKPPDRVSMPIDLLVGPPDARLQSGFCHDLQVRPVTGDRRVAILHDADTLDEAAANSLLKTIEEPPRGAVVMLIGTNEQKQLPTIRSRCRTIRLGPLAVADAVTLLRERTGVDDDAALRDAVEASGGDLDAAARTFEGDDDNRRALAALMSAPEIEPAPLVRVLTAYHDAAGKEAPRRREALKEAFGVAVATLRRRVRRSPAGVDDRTLARLDRSVRAVRQVDRMANQATLIQAYAADIALGRSEDDGEIGS